MSYRSAAHTQSSWAHDRSHSSGDDRSWTPSKSRFQEPQKPASTADEAMWRAAKRVSSAWRWLVLELSLLAERDKHTKLIDSLEQSLDIIGESLLPNLGKSPLSSAEASKHEVLDLVSVLASIRKGFSGNSVANPNIGIQTDDVVAGGSSGDEHGKPAQSHNRLVKKSHIAKHVQTKGEYMVRFHEDEFSGDWEALDASSCRRGALIDCISSTSSDTTGTFNFLFPPGQEAKILNVDDDGDAEICALDGSGIEGLWLPSERRWLLKDSYDGFRIWKPKSSNTEDLQESLDHE